jgi:hypothetical protein
MDAHALSELRSLAAHRLIAEQLLHDPQVVVRAEQRLARWSNQGAIHVEYQQRWASWLSLPPSELAEQITEDSERGREMGQTSPFAGELEPRLRWK